MDIQKIIVVIFAAGVLVIGLINREKIQKFVIEVIVELKKVSWPTPKELIDSTLLVLITSIGLGLFIGVADFALSKCLSLMIK